MRDLTGNPFTGLTPLKRRPGVVYFVDLPVGAEFTMSNRWQPYFIGLVRYRKVTASGYLELPRLPANGPGLGPGYRLGTAELVPGQDLGDQYQNFPGNRAPFQVSDQQVVEVPGV